METRFTWISFYKELADRLLSYKDDRKAMISKVRQAHELQGMNFPKVESDNGNIPDMDPFTVFALFNRGSLKDETRKAICTGYRTVFDIQSELPDDFTGIPVHNYSRYCFYAFLGDEKRNNDCFEILWKLFEEAIRYAENPENEAVFIEWFNKAWKLPEIALSKLTMALYHVRPDTFVGLDENNKLFIRKKLNRDAVKEIRDGDSYLRFCGEIRDFIAADKKLYSISEFSAAAYDDNKWFPRPEIYQPEITVEKWVEILKNGQICSEATMQLLYGIIELGGVASCTQLAEKYGGTAAQYNSRGTQFARNCAKYTGCPLYKDKKGEEPYWPIPFIGKYSTGGKNGYFIWKLRDELMEALKYMNQQEGNNGQEPKMGTGTDISRNTILFGPPGTGKTYHTVVYAVAIIEKKRLDEIAKEPYSEVMERYRHYKEEGFVEFTTFHQSYGYEEFIEGIKPVMQDSDEDSGEIGYEIAPGIFRSFCEEAGMPISKDTERDWGLNDNPAVWKVSLGGAGDNSIRQDCMNNERIRVGYDFGDNDKDIADAIESKKPGYKVINAFINKMRIGDIVLSCFDSKQIDAIGVITGDYDRRDEYMEYKWQRDVKWIVKGIREDIVKMNGAAMTLPTVYQMGLSVADVMKIVDKHNTGATKKNDRNYVFIVDEINRGNISKIFGELITLIEPSKRIGKEEAASVILPYSRKPFGVPDNVYLIGTMNTADRSIALMDTALRRRFRFCEMMPDPAVLGGITVEGLSVSNMLSSMNRKISVLFDREHTIGHAYFMPLKDTPTLDKLSEIFRNSIIPLLQEYFYDDYEKIRLVLGDNRTNRADEQFILADNADLTALFGDVELDIDGSTQYVINSGALQNIAAYKKI